MTTPLELQTYLQQTGRYRGQLDGATSSYWYGPLTKAAILLALRDGPDTSLTNQDYQASATRLGAKPYQIKAFASVEANGSGFQDGYPKILPEPHRFSKNTNHRFDASHPTISYPKWGTRPYPATQTARYDELLQMIGLDIDAGFASASYGKFQIMGENYKACGYQSSMEFAFGQAKDEPTQLEAFEGFIRNNGLLNKLRQMGPTKSSCTPIALGYNGTAQAKNNYDGKLAAAVAKFIKEGN